MQLLRTCALFCLALLLCGPFAVRSASAADCEAAYKDFKEIQDNEAELLKRLQQNPECGKFNVKLGDIYFQKKMWADALKNYDKALTFFPNSKYVQDQQFEAQRNAPVQLKEGGQVDLAAEVSKRGLGGTKKLPPFAVEVHFAKGSAEITAPDKTVLDKFGEIVKNNYANYSFEVQGHTDATGSPQTNMSLSEKRAAAVKDYLQKKQGLEPAKLQVKGYGDTQPIASNQTEEGMAQNRRVQFQGFQN